MLQRIGLAMALLARPAIAFLDEPTSGLDPFGRRLVRDVIRKARAEGTTIFLNSHFLSEVEITCDQVAFIRQGRVIRAGAIPALTDGLVRITLRVGQVTPALVADLNRWGSNIQPVSEQEVSLQVASQERIPELTAWLVAQGVRVYGLMPHQISLEELFVQIVGDGGDGAGGDEA
jgi:ABC-2 type transport system ATP-binding protein